jgi:hypothetical protein
MRRVLFLVFALTLVGNTGFSQTVKPAVPKARQPAKAPISASMTNADVIKMSKAGLSEDIIIGSIQRAKKCAFDLSADGLIGLKTAGITDRLMLVMQSDGQLPALTTPASAPAIAAPPPVASRNTAPATPVAVAVDDAKKPHEPGIYALLGGKVQLLEPTVATSAGTGIGNMAASGFTMGIKKVKIKANIRGSRSQVRVESGTEFYFYGSSLFNPNEYVLARLESGNDKREIVVGEGGLLGSRAGVRDEDQIKVTVTRFENGVYRVVPSRDLSAGEYGFIALGNTTNQKLWDFGIDK